MKTAVGKSCGLIELRWVGIVVGYNCSEQEMWLGRAAMRKTVMEKNGGG